MACNSTDYGLQTLQTMVSLHAICLPSELELAFALYFEQRSGISKLFSAHHHQGHQQALWKTSLQASLRYGIDNSTFLLPTENVGLCTRGCQG